MRRTDVGSGRAVNGADLFGFMRHGAPCADPQRQSSCRRETSWIGRFEIQRLVAKGLRGVGWRSAGRDGELSRVSVSVRSTTIVGAISGASTELQSPKAWTINLVRRGKDYCPA